MIDPAIYSNALQTVQQNVGMPLHAAVMVILEQKVEMLKEEMVDASGEVVAKKQGAILEIRSIMKRMAPPNKPTRALAKGDSYTTL